VEVVVITAALAGLLLAGFLPFGVDGLGEDDRDGRGAVAATVVVHFLLCLVTMVKGKVRLALFGLVVPFVALVGSVRLARPGSPWARRLYRNRPRTRARAERRAQRHDRRWSARMRAAQDVIGGRPDDEEGRG
jgi:hypothetical protein